MTQARHQAAGLLTQNDKGAAERVGGVLCVPAGLPPDCSSCGQTTARDARGLSLYFGPWEPQVR